jgi:hypothetical protein
MPAALVLLALLGAGQGDEARNMSAVANPSPKFQVRVALDRPFYRGGDTLTATVRSEKAGYLYLLNIGADGAITCLFPNRFQPDNRIAARKPVRVPADDTFKIRIHAPYGREVVKAIVTLEPLTAVKVADLVRAAVTPVSDTGAKNMRVELGKRSERPFGGWAEHSVETLTLDPTRTPPDRPAKRRRVGLFVGISVYHSAHVRRACAFEQDARQMAALMKARGGLDEALVLVNARATRAAVEKAIRHDLAARTRPGDCVVLYWSGHGGRCAVPGGSGWNEALAPYDVDLTDTASARRTMILDDVFLRWLQDLDGRQIVLVLDACRAGGMLKLSAARDLPAAESEQPFFARVAAGIRELKALGQTDLGLLASCRASEASYLRKDGKHSVMTWYLLDALRAGDTALDLGAVHARLQPRVRAYVRAEHGAVQTPVLVDTSEGKLVLRPGSATRRGGDS